LAIGSSVRGMLAAPDPRRSPSTTLRVVPLPLRVRRGGGASLNAGQVCANSPRMSEETPPALPDRLSVDPNSPYYDADVLQRNVGVRFKGQDKTNVEEYCVSEGWVRLAVGNSKDRHGNALTMKLQGPVEPYYREG
jgi:hypothetical protein